MKLAGAFDAGHIRGWSPDWQQELDFHQLELTGHAEQLPLPFGEGPASWLDGL